MAKYSFRAKKYVDHEIVDSGGQVIGHIRVKPSGIAWSPKNCHNWHGCSLEAFATFMELQNKIKR
jgi:hypothetical protein